MMNSHESVHELVAALPEVYQPIYGYPELSSAVSRMCEDRLAYIKTVCCSLAKWLQRPVRVLDLGCAQGYFSFRLAEAGAIVIGIDHLPQNIALNQALAAEHPELKVSFQLATIEDTLKKLEPAQFDLVLGLSVFHHLVYQYGAGMVTELLSDVSRKVTVGVFELALRSEPLYWATAQLDDAEGLLSGFAFVHELGRFLTHLSSIKRPLYFASNHFCFFSRELYPFSRCLDEPHFLAQGVHQGTRRYYLGNEYLCKRFRLNGELADVNLNEINREIALLSTKLTSIKLPALLESGATEREAWLVRTSLPGTLLVELMEKGQRYDAGKVIYDVLKQLATFEDNGFYHNDVRVWNVIIGSGGEAHLIDYGSISKEKIDCVWPNNPFLAFWIFVRDVVTGIVPRIHPHRQPFISPLNLPEPYRAWALNVWRRPVKEWSFKLLLEEFELKFLSGITCVSNNDEEKTEELWMQAMEAYSDGLSKHINFVSDSVDVVQKSIETMQKKIDSLAELLSRQEQIQEEAMAKAKNTIQQYENELRGVYTSWSWKLTRPLREINAIRRVVARKVISFVIRTLKYSVGFSVKFVLTRPRLKRFLLDKLVHFPQLSHYLRAKAFQALSLENCCTENLTASGEGEYIDIFLLGITIKYHTAALIDQRGIGRVSRELLNQLQSLSNQESRNYQDAGQPVYFYSTIHWCPEELPHPCCILIHDVIPLLFPESFGEVALQWEKRLKPIAQQADCIVTISHSSAEDISRLLEIPRERISVIYNGVTELPVGDEPVANVPDAPYFVFLGSNDRHKNLDVVLQALTYLKDTPIHLCLIGHNEDASPRAKQLGIVERVRFLGRLRDEQVGQVVSRAVGLVFPSLYEGFGLPPLEAALLGVPSICSKRPAMTGILAEACLFCETDKPEEWAEAMRQFWVNKDFRNDIASKARAKAVQFSWRAQVDNLIQTLFSLSEKTNTQNLAH